MLKTIKNFFAKLFLSFFAWYKRNYKLNLFITTGLFALQLVHLYWMAADIIGLRLFGQEFWHVGKVGTILISLVDYTEIPALILGSMFYLNEVERGVKWRSIFYLVLLNSQWLHLFWITDEVILTEVTGNAAVLIPAWIAWCAILIDYLELPIIYDTAKKTVSSLRKSS